MAQKSGVPLIPVGVSARPRWLAKSWDRYMVPMPFGRGCLIAGEPIFVPFDADEETVEQCRKRLEDEMNRLEQEAERYLGLS